jgi:hypothetical protein
MKASEGENVTLYAHDNVEAKLHRKYLLDNLKYPSSQGVQLTNN